MQKESLPTIHPQSINLKHLWDRLLLAACFYIKVIRIDQRRFSVKPQKAWNSHSKNGCWVYTTNCLIEQQKKDSNVSSQNSLNFLAAIFNFLSPSFYFCNNLEDNKFKWENMFSLLRWIFCYEDSDKYWLYYSVDSSVCL